MGQRSRKRRSATARPAAATPPPAATKPDPNAGMRRGYARGEARNEAIRAQLEPLAPGERPTAVTVAAVAAVVLFVANLVAALLSDPTPAEWRFVAIQSAVLLIAAAGMWRARYWAVLGFQALLGLAILLAFLALLRASNLAAVAYTVATIVLAGALFWFLVKAMARIQMPERPTRDGA